MSDSDPVVALDGVRPLILPARRVRREEACGRCYWVAKAPGGGLECHGAPPTCHVLMQPHPMDRSKQYPQPLCVWPPVLADGFCRHWELRGEEPAAAASPNPGVV